ncbi:MAG: MoxR family ATPase [Chloroflexi bacterium]|nr:MoxR family ATPase [Chloroflexota bacterium]
MERHDYIAEPAIATAVHLAKEMRKPLLIEGDAGVGKTEIAKVLARMLDTELIRLQCYEGLDVNTALYEWNYPKQMLRIRMEEGTDHSVEEKEHVIFSPAFLLQRPLLRAISADEKAPVLLIDEVDRADEEFEAFLLEVLSDFQVTIPELGTIRAKHRPYVVLTSNRTRELSDALKRRCLYLWVDYPTFDKEVRIVRNKVDGVNDRLANQIAAFMQVVRHVKLNKTPGVAETLDWAAGLIALHRDHLDPEAVSETLGCILKDRFDVERLRGSRLDLILNELNAVPEEQLATCSAPIVSKLEAELSR